MVCPFHTLTFLLQQLTNFPLSLSLGVLLDKLKIFLHLKEELSLAKCCKDTKFCRHCKTHQIVIMMTYSEYILYVSYTNIAHQVIDE